MMSWYRRVALVMIMALLLVTMPGPVAAQGGGNLLANPGFEGFYRSYGSGQDLVLEFRVADGWSPWFRRQGPDDPEWQYRRPEYRPASYSYNGSAAQQFFTSFGTHEAGLFQQVSRVAPGQAYRFSLATYIWSSMGGNFFRSEQPGVVSVRVGIDPAGGTNPYASSVVWSPFATFYDEWRVLFVDAVAQASRATVFVWSSAQYPVVHNDVALDDAYFGPAASAPMAASAAPAAAHATPAAAPVVEEAPAAPPAEAAPAASGPVLSPTGITVTVDANVRMRASLYGQVLDVIPAGATVAALGRSADLNWTAVEYNGQQGWIGSWLGYYSQPFESLPELPLP
ncbi:MAG: SH3 domain-containing protein [Anaerolineae bacterium]|nr:SH3 domain-containing protein [Anaerolineae bacterium]